MLRLAVALSALAGSCAAVTLIPSDRQIANALKSGAALVNPNSGYPLKGHVIFEVPDARDIKPAWGDVDAVVVATPLERARHAGYVARLSGERLDVAAARRLPELRSGSLSILVYAHGSDHRDETFVDRFGGASLIFDAATIVAAETTHSEVSEATYPSAAFERERQVAVVSYRFDLTAFPGLADSPCRLRFNDPTGKTFDIPLDLARYR